ncbi:hypothetical protein SNK04_014350 [Fusarium graminearum]
MSDRSAPAASLASDGAGQINQGLAGLIGRGDDLPANPVDRGLIDVQLSGDGLFGHAAGHEGCDGVGGVHATDYASLHRSVNASLHSTRRTVMPDHSEMNYLAKNLRYLARKSEIKQAALGERLGVQQSTVQRIMSGRPSGRDWTASSPSPTTSTARWTSWYTRTWRTLAARLSRWDSAMPP